MLQKQLLMVDANGIQEVLITTRPLNITQAVVARLGETASRSIKGIWPSLDVNGHKSGCVCAQINKSMAAFTVPLDHIKLRCPFAINENKELYAAFDSTTAPKMSLDWYVPENMWVSLVVICHPQYPEIQNQYFVATIAGGSDGKFYRLPLPNVYENCVLCAGKFPLAAETYMQIVRRAVDQFYASDWNMDLFGRGQNDQVNSTKLFRFLPKGETVIEQKYDFGDWRKLCTVVSDITLETMYAIY